MTLPRAADLAAYTSGVLRARAAYHDEQGDPPMADPPTCTCDIAEITRRSLEGLEQHPCPVHLSVTEELAGTPPALNSDDPIDTIGAALSGATHTNDL